MENKSFFKKIAPFGVLLILFFTGTLAWNNRWDIHDRWVSRSYLATIDSEEVRKNLSLNSEGDLVFRASLTEVDSKEKFREKCPVERYEEANVLGCYSARKIYVLKVDEARLNGVEEVTAAHELLHAQYERMDSGIKNELKEQLSLVKDSAPEDVRDLIESYRKEIGDGDELFNEMYAIFGTQVAELNPELEEYYSQYFQNRKGIVEYYNRYNGEFKKIEAEIALYDTELNSLRVQKENLEKELESLGVELEVRKKELDQLEADGANEEYVNQATIYNKKVASYNSSVEAIRELVDSYNGIVERRNSLALSAKDLQDELNASVEEVR